MLPEQLENLTNKTARLLITLNTEIIIILIQNIEIVL